VTLAGEAGNDADVDDADGRKDDAEVQHLTQRNGLNYETFYGRNNLRNCSNQSVYSLLVTSTLV
jgi:hypothetical protein